MTIAFDPVVAAPKARASGILVVPAPWKIRSPSAVVDLVGLSSDGSDQRHVLVFQAVPGLPGSYSFDIPPSEVGTYAFHLLPFGWTQVFDLPLEGRKDLRFELPPPVELTVQVVEKDTGDPVDATVISWRPVGQEGSPNGGREMQMEPESRGLFRFDVTQGKIYVSCSRRGYQRASELIDATRARKVTLQLERAIRGTVTLRDGVSTIPWPAGSSVDVEPLDGGEGGHHSSGSAAGKRWFGVDRPGRYRIAIPEISGFEPHEPVEFEMLRGQQVELVIELVRR